MCARRQNLASDFKTHCWYPVVCSFLNTPNFINMFVFKMPSQCLKEGRQKKHKVFAGSVHMNSSRQHHRFKLVPQVAPGTKGFIKSRVIHRNNWKMVGQFTWLEDCGGWLEAVSKRQEGQNWRSLALCYGALLMRRSQPWQLWQPYKMPLGQDQRSSLQGESFSRQLLLTSKPRQ